MKKRLLALAFVILVFPVALLLTACGGSKLQTGKTYVLDSLEIAWGSEQEANMILAGMTETAFIEQTKAALKKCSIEFKTDGTAVAVNDGEHTTYYYTTEGETVTIYSNAGKTLVEFTLQISGEKLVQEQTIEGMTTIIKTTYKVGTIGDDDYTDDDGDDDDDDDGDVTPQLVFGQTYIFDKLEVVWASEQEKQMVLGTITEQLFVQMVEQQMDSTVIIFNQDGTLSAKVGSNTETNYYTVNQQTVNIYETSDQAEVVATMTILENAIVMESEIEDGMTSKLKITYKIGTPTDDGDDDDDDGDVAQLQIGKTYVFNDVEIVWASPEEKGTILSLTGKTEEQLVATMRETLTNTYLLFNQNGTLSSNAGDGVEGATFYYSVKGDNIIAYEDSANTIVAATMKLVGDAIVHNEEIVEGFETYIKMTYKVGTIIDDGDDDDDDNKDEGQLQIGKTYIVYGIEFNWATEQEKEMFLGSVSEQQFIAMMLTQMQDAYIVFNQDESVVSVTFGEEYVSYYSVNGDTITIYHDLEKTEFAATLKVVGNTLV